MKFACLPLHLLPVICKARQAVLMLAPDEVPCTLWQSVYELSDTACIGSCDVEAWYLSDSDEQILDFAPGRRIYVKMLEPRKACCVRDDLPQPVAPPVHRLPLAPYVAPGGGDTVHSQPKHYKTNHVLQITDLALHHTLPYCVACADTQPPSDIHLYAYQ